MKGSKSKVRDGVETRVRPSGLVRHRARVRVLGKVIVGPFREQHAAAVADRDGIRARKREAVSGEAMTLRGAMDAMVAEARARRRREHTIVSLEKNHRNLLLFFRDDALLSSIGPENVERFVAARLAGTIEGRKPVSVYTALEDVRTLRSILLHGMRRGWCSRDVTKLAVLPEVDTRRQPDWFTEPALRALLDRIRSWPDETATSRDLACAIVELLALTGLRLREAADLLVRDVRIDDAVMIVTAGKRGSRSVHLADDAVEIVREMVAGKAPADHVLPRRDAIRGVLARWARRLGEPRLHPHALRHTYGTAVARRTRSALAVAAALGHRTIAQAMRYCHLAGVDAEHVATLSYRSGEAPLA